MGHGSFPKSFCHSIANAMNDEPVPVYGDGQNVRDWIYVEDHCRAILAVGEKWTFRRGLQHRRTK